MTTSVTISVPAGQNHKARVRHVMINDDGSEGALVADREIKGGDGATFYVATGSLLTVQELDDPDEGRS